MTNEEFLRDVCPNHTDKSQWNKSELLHILELHKEQLRLNDVSHRMELLFDFVDKIEEDRNLNAGYIGRWYVEKYLSNNCG